MRKTISALGALFAVAGGLSAAAPKSKIKIALIVQDTVDDKGWCQSMHDAIKAVEKEYGKGLVEYSYSEKMKPVDAGSAARQYATKHFDIIICHGAQYKNLVNELAPDYPATSFVFGTSADIGGKNVFTYMPQSEEAGYLNGMVAGLVTKSNILGVVGSVDGGDAARYERGFVLGAKAVNPAANVKVAHTGSFSDITKASELAKVQISAGADFLTGCSQQALGGLHAVAEFKGKAIWWVGQDVSHLALEPTKVLAASSYNYVAVVEGLIAKHDAHVMGGENLPMNFANKGFIYKFNDTLKLLKPADKKKVEKAKAEMTSGKLKLDWKAVKF